MKYPAIIRTLTVCFLCLSPLTQSITAQKSSEEKGAANKVFSPVLTGAPILSITPDAKATGMADIGAATQGGAFALFHNLSLLTEVENNWGISIGYTPWMPDISADMNLSSIYGYYRWNGIGGLKYALSGSLRYFNIGETTAFSRYNSTDLGRNDPVLIHPYELAVNLGFAIGLGSHWSIAQTMGFLYSDYHFSLSGKDAVAYTPLLDISANYRSSSIAIDTDVESVIKVGLAVNNIGGKLSYDNGATTLFLPTILRLGEGLDINFGQDGQELGIYLEQSKILAPTMPVMSKDMSQKASGNMYKDDSSVAAFSALFTSWSDASGGFAEELKEIMLSIGAEYRYRGRLDFDLRIGYKHQHEDKGSDSGITLGAGLYYQRAKLDLSYFVANKIKSPLNNMFRISLGIDF